MSTFSLSPRPALGIDDVIDIVTRLWGLPPDRVQVSDLGSLTDGNFRVVHDTEEFVFKIAGADIAADLDLQNSAMAAVHDRVAPLTTPLAVPSLAGRTIEDVDGHLVRMLTWVPGQSLVHRRSVTAVDFTELARVAAVLAEALTGFQHPRQHRDNLWDCRRSVHVVTELTAHQPASGFLDRLRRAVEPLAAAAEVLGRLPHRVAHGDLTEYNAAFDGPGHATGVFDFGDVMYTARVGDLSVPALAAISHPRTRLHPLDGVAAALTGYHAVTPLLPDEVELLWPLLRARAALWCAIAYTQEGWSPDTITTGGTGEGADGWRALLSLETIPDSVAAAHLRAAVAAPAGRRAAVTAWIAAQDPAPMVPEATGPLTVVDLGIDSDLFTAGEWRSPADLDGLLAAERARAGTDLVTRWNERTPIGTDGPARQVPHTMTLGVDLVLDEGVPVVAPVAGLIEQVGDEDVLVRLGDPARTVLRLSGLTPEPGLVAGAHIGRAERIGRTARSEGRAHAYLHVQLEAEPNLPDRGVATHAQAWLDAAPDPSTLLGADVAAPDPVTDEELRAQRARAVGGAQGLYYERPPQIVRGWGHHLYDSDARPYLDMINNIAAVGHSHPRVTAAATRQLRKLNTNSRFLYSEMARYADRLAEFLPAELDTVLTVNSGSEAVDLALQISRAATGHRDVVALAGAYHGWTGAVLDVSTSTVDRPDWRAGLAAHVHVADQPNLYSGVHGDNVDAYLDSLRACLGAAQLNGGVAAFIAEPLLGNQGGVELPPGYLSAAYAATRQAGGLCIADEVQVGMARSGRTFWAFEHEGVVPDIVCAAKSTGNGYPLGVVVTRREIADQFDQRASYFSSTAGSPVACAIGRTVLDIIADEQLQANADRVGRHLKARLLDLMPSHELIGAVHGRGLYQGVELVRDRIGKAPAVQAATQVSEALRPLGVIMQPTGDELNVLKIKPPMCLDEASADYFVDALDCVLSDIG